jgi:hypothetical protein
MRKQLCTKILLLYLGIAISMAGCASRYSPEGWLPSLYEVQHQAFGSWITAECLSEGKSLTLSGELIALEGGKLIALDENRAFEIPVSDIRRMRLENFREARMAGMWAFLGTLSTLSHGYYLMISAPVWIVSGVMLAAGESRTGLVEYKGPPPDEIRKFARFPQGLPKGIDRKSLRPKPMPKR